MSNLLKGGVFIVCFLYSDQMNDPLLIINKNAGFITSYDVVKTLAMLLMIIDHLGQYFFPDVTELRLIGRLSAPIWLFLIGYARTRGDIAVLLGAGVLVQLSHVLTAESWWYLDILFLFAAIRLSLDWVMAQVLSHRMKAIAVAIFLGVLALPSWFLIMYGSAGYMIAMLGYMIRHRADDARITDRLIYGYAFVAYIAYIICSLIGFSGFDMYVQVLVVDVAILFFGLYFFRPHCFSIPARSGVGYLFQLGGRYSLYLYVTHLIAFRFISFWF